MSFAVFDQCFLLSVSCLHCHSNCIWAFKNTISHIMDVEMAQLSYSCI